MIVAVTGGFGFIGREVVARHLADGDRVRVLSRVPRAPRHQRVEIHQADLVNATTASLQHFVDGADILYHCAGTFREAEHMLPVHVRGTRVLAEAAAGRIGRWVQLSSVGVYGPVRSGVVAEDTPCRPLGTYEVTKAQSDDIVTGAGGKGSFEFAIVRPSIVFGRSMRNRSLFQLASMIDRGWFAYIGAPGASANYVHVANVVDAMRICGVARAAADRAYIVSDWAYLEEFVEIIAAKLHRPPPTRRVPELPVRVFARLFGSIPGQPVTPSRVDALTNRARYSTARIEKELGYASQVSIEQGLTELLVASQGPVE